MPASSSMQQWLSLPAILILERERAGGRAASASISAPAIFHSKSKSVFITLRAFVLRPGANRSRPTSMYPHTRWLHGRGRVCQREKTRDRASEGAWRIKTENLISLFKRGINFHFLHSALNQKGWCNAHFETRRPSATMKIPSNSQTLHKKRVGALPM